MLEPDDLMSAYQRYSGLALALASETVDPAGTDAEMSRLEERLAKGPVKGAADLLAKALYIRDCAGIDPGQVRLIAIETLIEGISKVARIPIPAHLLALAAA